MDTELQYYLEKSNEGYAIIVEYPNGEIYDLGGGEDNPANLVDLIDYIYESERQGAFNDETRAQLIKQALDFSFSRGVNACEKEKDYNRGVLIEAMYKVLPVLEQAECDRWTSGEPAKILPEAEEIREILRKAGKIDW